METGRVVKAARLKAKLSQGKLARALGWTTSQYVSNVERGLCGFPARKGKLFCRITKLSPSKLVKAMENDWHEWLWKEWNQ